MHSKHVVHVRRAERRYLGHDQLTISSDTYPLGVANLATYLEAYLDRPVPLDGAIFRQPDRLMAALDSAGPDAGSAAMGA